MNQLKKFSINQPFIFVLLLVSASITTVYSHQLISFDDIFIKDLASSVIKNIITVLLLVMTIRLNFLDKTQLNTGYKHWHTKWWLAALPMALIALLNSSSIAWNTLELAPLKVIGWLYINTSTGVFEEVLLRGLCFAVLYNAWKNKDNGLIKAALCQALIFGVAHYVNLTKAPFIEVTIQVMYATLIGIGFAGLVAFSRSLWPAILLHTLINSVGTISEYFQPNYVSGELSLINYAVVITIIAIICALPGYFLLKRAQLALPNHTLTKG